MQDPYLLLGADRQADDEAIHAAYLEAIKACPPERAPEHFEALRQAYEAIRTQRRRLARELFDTTPAGALDILEQAAPRRPPGRPDIADFQALLRGQD